jgi:hypothetical protein
MKCLTALLIGLSGLNFPITDNYPIDGYSSTGIRRLAYLEEVKNGTFPNAKLLTGALKPLSEIVLNLDNETLHGLDSLPAVDPDLQKAINGIFQGLDPNYSIAVMDITKGKPIRFAERKGLAGYQPGSVANIRKSRYSQLLEPGFGRRV